MTHIDKGDCYFPSYQNLFFLKDQKVFTKPGNIPIDQASAAEVSKTTNESSAKLHPNILQIMRQLEKVPAHKISFPSENAIAQATGPALYLPILDLHYESSITEHSRFFIDCISTYKPEAPFDPIADRFDIRLYDQTSCIVLTDGCGLSPSSRLAPKAAIDGFYQYLLDHPIGSITDTRQLSHHLLEAIDRAHLNIFWQAYIRSKEDLDQYQLYLKSNLKQFQVKIQQMQEETLQFQNLTHFQNFNNLLNANYHTLSSEINDYQHNVDELLLEIQLIEKALLGDLTAKRELIETEWAKNQQRFYVGTTTFLAAILTKASIAGPDTHYVNCVNVGDAKAFRYTKDELTEITAADSRPNINDVRDPGGRLGYCSYISLQADLRNLRLSFIPCSEGDLLLFMTDGVSDNLDPERLGLKPNGPLSSQKVIDRFKTCSLFNEEEMNTLMNALNAKIASWEHISNKDNLTLKKSFTNALLTLFIKKYPSLTEVNQAVINFCKTMTSGHREYDINYDKPYYPNFEDLPGKPDHTTFIILKVE